MTQGIQRLLHRRQQMFLETELSSSKAHKTETEQQEGEEKQEEEGVEEEEGDEEGEEGPQLKQCAA